MRWKLFGAIAGCALTLAACTVDGTAVDDAHDSAGSPSIDLSALDTGDYATDPAAPLGHAEKPARQVMAKAQRLGDHLALGHEVAGELTVGRSFEPIMMNTQLSNVFRKGVAELPINAEDSLLYGARMTADEPRPVGTGKSVVLAVLRYRDAATAKRAVTEFDKVPRSDAPGAKTSTAPLRGLPDTSVQQTTDPSQRQAVTSTLTSYGPYLIHVYAAATDDQLQWTETAARTSLDLQKPLLDEFDATPGVNDSAPIELDEHDLLRYAVPAVETEDIEARMGAVYTPRGQAHTWGDTRLAYDTFTEFSPYIGEYMTTVYRTETAERATEFVAFLDTDDRAGGATDTDSPKGLPDVLCVTKPLEYGEYFGCRTQVGRYVGQASGSDLADVHQQISAQYVILTKADQNAG